MFSEFYMEYEYNFSNFLLKDDELMTGFEELSSYEKSDFLTRLTKMNTHELFYLHLEENFSKIIFVMNQWLEEDKDEFEYSERYNQFVKFIFKYTKEQKSFQEKKEVLDIFLDKASLNVNTKIDKIPLIHLAAQDDDLELVQYLMNKGARTDLVDNNRYSLADASLNSKKMNKDSVSQLEVFNFVINQANFDPLKGGNILSTALYYHLDDALEMIIKTNLLANQELIEKAKDVSYFSSDEAKSEYFTHLDKAISQYEQRVLEEKMKETNMSQNKKVKI